MKSFLQYLHNLFTAKERAVFLAPESYLTELIIRTEVYKVIFDARMKDFGETDYLKQLIKLRSVMSHREIFKTWIHEVYHALDNEYHIGLTHKQVYKLEEATFNLIWDNYLG